LPEPAEPLVVGIDGGSIHAREGERRKAGSLEVIVGKSLGAQGLFKEVASVCFEYTQIGKKIARSSDGPQAKTVGVRYINLAAPKYNHNCSIAIPRFTALWEQYQRSRQALALPLKLADGNQLYLTPGKHNALQVAIIEKFGPRYAAEATVLYLGDAANKFVIFEQVRLGQLGIPITTHDKLPDIILYDEKKNWLYLIEAVTSHGPVLHKRKDELEKLLKDCPARRIYITAFLNDTEFKRHFSHIAWETDIWIAEIPEHMVHLNGEKFLKD